MSVSSQERLTSLDIFRGLTIAGMILVNNAGNWSAVYHPLRHSAWNGWTLTDLIFPFFLFIVGVAMTFSFGKLTENGSPRTQIYQKVFRRTLNLFLPGLLLNIFPFFHLHPFEWMDFSTFRIMGVLQRIAPAYLFAYIILLECGRLGQWLWTIGILDKKRIFSKV